MKKDSVFIEFCKQQSDTLYSANTRKRKSILLQIKDDIDYNLGIYKTFKSLGLTPEQYHQIDTELAPLFVVPLLYCSSVDLMARIKHKGAPGRGQNAKVFKESAQLFFELDEIEASKLWVFRNSISHQYSIRNFVLSRYGQQKVVATTNERTVISVRPMRGSLRRASDNLFDYLMAEDEESKNKTAHFLEKHGFSYYLVV